MHALRRARFLARLVLAWFVLSLGVAVASPVIKPAGLQLVCSGTAIKLVASGDEGTPSAGHTLDCPLCAATAAPPAALPAGTTFDPGLQQAVRRIPAARIAALTAAPLPARGPPLS